MEAAGLGARKSCLIEFKNYKLLPAAAIFGKNSGGKSNVIRAFWLAVQFMFLVNLIISKFQSKRTNPNGAQIIFTTHNVELMNLELLRKDQIYLVDKKQEDGASDLYSISDFTTRTTDNIRKGYFIGKFGAVPDVEIEEVE